jgi:SpoVK/Ycf46/Vps4 family AAA+-type ATPase
MNSIKTSITDQIVAILCNLVPHDTLMNAVITGSPGTGKSTLINILSRVYKCLGYLPTDKVTIATRADLIGQYLGETTRKTLHVLNSAKGGILLIDEVYSIYSARDSSDDQYGRECLNVINQFLTENPRFICIVAGYKKDVDRCFFDQNKGLKRRFPWNFHIEDYTIDELVDVFFSQSNDKDKNKNKKYTVDFNKEVLNKLFKEHEAVFVGNGGDTRELFDKSKLFYAKRALSTGLITFDQSDKNTNTIINTEHTIIINDVENAIKLMSSMRIKNNALCDYCTVIESGIKESSKCKKCMHGINSMIY